MVEVYFSYVTYLFFLYIYANSSSFILFFFFYFKQITFDISI